VHSLLFIDLGKRQQCHDFPYTEEELREWLIREIGLDAVEGRSISIDSLKDIYLTKRRTKNEAIFRR
jgi:hypothetical protein